MEILASPLRAKSGPVTRKDARILRTSSEGASVPVNVDASKIISSSALLRVILTPKDSITWQIVPTSSKFGISSNLLGVDASKVPAIIGSTAFLALLTRTRPSNRLPP